MWQAASGDYDGLRRSFGVPTLNKESIIKLTKHFCYSDAATLKEQHFRSSDENNAKAVGVML